MIATAIGEFQSSDFGHETDPIRERSNLADDPGEHFNVMFRDHFAFSSEQFENQWHNRAGFVMEVISREVHRYK
jgi:hypothetical protein